MSTPLILEKLKEFGRAYLENDPDELGIKFSLYPNEGLLVLNYDQINSPKMDLITQECRGLILSYPELQVVSRSFDRFFNHGEADNDGFELQPGDRIVEKVDGSLIKMYNYRNQWNISTRGTAFAESQAGDSGRSFRDLFLAALPFSFPGHFEYLDKGCTYLFELCTEDNRVVRQHEGYNITYLGTRVNATGDYVDHREQVKPLGASLLAEFTFDTLEDCVEAAGSLPDLEEGYVVRRAGVPVCKIKSPIYVAAHHVFTGTMTLKKMTKLVLLGEVPEFAVYFPDYAEMLEKYAGRLEIFLGGLDNMFPQWNRPGLSQKDFALSIKDFNFSALLFRARKDSSTPSEAFHTAKDSYKLDLAMGLFAYDFNQNYLPEEESVVG